MNAKNLLKSCCVLTLIALADVVCASTANVSLGTVTSHDPWDGKFDVPYTVLNADPATDYKVAFEVTAGGRTVAITNAAARLADGAYVKTLDSTALFGKATTAASAEICVLLIALKPEGAVVDDATGAAVGAIGDVMVIDVSGGAEATSYPVSYHTGVDMGTFNCDVYKTTKIVLRKIAAGTPHYVKPGETNVLTQVDRLTPANDYYIGIFPVTVAQYARVMGVGDMSAQTPQSGVSWNELRGAVETKASITEMSEASFFQKLCQRTRLTGFDLPTEVQWEIAARADATTRYGIYLLNRHETSGTAENVSDFAVINAVSAVGTKCPNAWGLFDTAGNVAELCRDDYALVSDHTDVETPYVGTGISKVVRGGDYNTAAANVNVAERNTAMASLGSARNGFRLVRTCP